MHWQQFLGVLLFIIFLGACKQVQQQKTQNLQPLYVHNDLNPININQYLQTQLPDYHLIGRREFSKLWWSFYDKIETPYLVISDFNNDGVADYAALISNNKKIALIMLLGNGKSFKHWLAPDFNLKVEKNGLSYGLSVQPPAQVDAVRPEIKTLYLKNNGIMLNHYEIHSRIYYYDNETFKTFKMSEAGTTL